jgi:hypothetical protein
LADPNWLYSSIVQSSAAFVAIVGGLLTATVVNMLSKRNALLEEIADLDNQSDILHEHRSNVVADLEALRARFFIDDHEDELLPKIVALKPDEAMALIQDLRPDDISIAALETEGKRLVQLVQSERNWLIGQLKASKTFPKSFWRWRDSNEESVDDHDIAVLEALYDHIYESLRSRKGEQT